MAFTIDAPITEIAPETRLLVYVGMEPVAEAVQNAGLSGQFVFEARNGVDSGIPAEGLHGWIIAPDLVAQLIPQWPIDGSLRAEINSIGPGGASVWLQAGANQGVRIGDVWWLRVGGQPAARCEVRFVGPEVSYCSLMQLAREWAIEPGAVMALWPAPGERRVGMAHSAVAFVEERSHGTLVWLAAPQNVACAPEPHVDFYHNHHYVGGGLVERRDSRFWYARYAPAPSVPGRATNLPEPRTQDSQPAARPAMPGLVRAATQSATEPTVRLSVGDEVVIRTQEDVDRQRLVARVFDLNAAGALIDAGENEHLTAGQVLIVCRDDNVVGRAAIGEVQRTYATVVPSGDSGAAALELRVGDELRLTQPPPAPVVVGVIERLVDEVLFAARLTAPDPPLRTPLGVRAAGRTVGVAILLAANESQAAGFVLRCSTTRSLAEGMQLVYEADPPQRNGE